MIAGRAVRNTWPEQALLVHVRRDDDVRVSSPRPCGQRVIEPRRAETLYAVRGRNWAEATVIRTGGVPVDAVLAVDEEVQAVGCPRPRPPAEAPFPEADMVAGWRYTLVAKKTVRATQGLNLVITFSNKVSSDPPV